MPIYGIDLGTTNSLIGLHSENYLSSMVPSCVNLDTGVVGTEAYNDMQAKRSFKVDMSLGLEGNMPRVCSSKVLVELCKVAGGNVKDVVISVPAYFSDNQRQATIEAAKSIGLNVRGLVNEPTAAAMYIARNRRSLFIVFDLGGGTFDVSMIDARFGSYDVQATDGRILGGDDFDKSIMKYFAKQGQIPLHKLNAISRNALQHLATKMKVKMQKTRADFEVDLTPWMGTKIVFKEQDYIQLMKLTFGDTINMVKKIIEANIPYGEHYEILMVGGSTRCPYLREWLAEECRVEIPNLDYNPDCVVAQGAAFYAHLLENGEIDALVSDVTKALSIELADGTCNVLIEANSKVPLSQETMYSNSTEADSIRINLLQGDNTFAKDNECIGTLVWEYGEVKQPLEGQVIVKVDIDAAGVITFSVKEMLKAPKVVILDRSTSAVKC